MANYDTIDIDFTWDGDFVKGKDGDLGDTSDDHIRSLVNEIQSVVKSVFKDWEKDPHVAGDLDDYKGEPNSKDTGRQIENRVKSRLVAVPLVQPQDVQVRVVPVHVNQIMVIIRIQAVATPNNSLKPGEPVVVTFLYDSMEHDIFFLPPAQKDKDKLLF
jgi:hypothetical protein